MPRHNHLGAPPAPPGGKSQRRQPEPGPGLPSQCRLHKALTQLNRSQLHRAVIIQKTRLVAALGNPAKLFLVTSGFRRLQESKIRALAMAHLFTEVHIDAIDVSRPKGKLHVFETIIQTHHLSPKEVLAVGDNPDSEIAAGNRLGMTTIQILRPRVPASSAATHQIHRLGELRNAKLTRRRGDAE